MQKTARKPRPTILARRDLGNGRMQYTVRSTSRRCSYLVESVNFFVEKCSCPDHQYRNRDCKHICAVQWAEEDRRIEVERAKAEEQAKAEMAAKMAAYDVVAEAAKVVANVEAELDAAMYEVAATMKKCACCGHLYQPDRCQPGRCHWNGWYKPEAA